MNAKKNILRIQIFHRVCAMMIRGAALLSQLFYTPLYEKNFAYIRNDDMRKFRSRVR